MKYLFTSTLLFIGIQCFAQVSADIEINNVRARVNNNGILFQNSDGPSSQWSASFEVPKGGGASTIYTSSFWMGGMDQNMALRLAANRFAPFSEYSIGPMSNFSNSDAFQGQYDEIWRVTRHQIIEHQANYGNSNYQMPLSISSWPGNGNVAHGEAHFLAPFIDANGDGIYNPLHGDYPDIRGDEALYFMLNDANNPHEESGGMPIGVNIHIMVYSYVTDESSPINDCVFVNLIIRNNGTAQLSDFYFGMYNDFDLGAYHDDFIGSDSLRNMTYAYNGYAFDETVSGSFGYGSYLPAQGSVFLNTPMAKSVYYNNSLGNNGDPSLPIHYYNYMRGLWKDGSIVTEGGNGYGGSTPANFMLSGDPLTGIGWTEVNSGHSPGDRRMVMSTGPFDFIPGDQLCIDLAFPFARSEQENDNLDAIVKLREAADYVQAFYDNQNFSCQQQVVGVEHVNEESSVALYPNPNAGRFFVTADKDISMLEISDIYGQIISSHSSIQSSRKAIEVDMTHHAAGVYLYQLVLSNGDRRSGKVIVN
jgi:hypothetical protein